MAVSGDEAAFAQIVVRHREKIQGLADRFLRNHADAEEITQDTFILFGSDTAKLASAWLV